MKWWERYFLKKEVNFYKSYSKIPLTTKSKNSFENHKRSQKCSQSSSGVKIEHEFNEKVNTSTALAMQVKMQKDLKVNWAGEPIQHNYRKCL